MRNSQLVCGDCGSEVRQVGAYMKCQNMECQLSVPIDIDMLRKAIGVMAEEQARQAPEQ